MSGYSQIIALDGPCEGRRQILGQVDENGVPDVEVNVSKDVYPDLQGFGPNLAAGPIGTRVHRYRRAGFNEDLALWEYTFIDTPPKN